MAKCLAVKTAENVLEPTAQSNAVATAMKLAVLQKQAEQGFGFNDEIWITESGEFAVPYDGVYEVTCIGGGYGGFYNTADRGMNGGAGSAPVVKTVFLQKGQVVPVIIGAGGAGGYEGSLRTPGATKFGDVVCNPADGAHYISGSFYLWYNASTGSYSSGYGYGGGVGGGLAASNGAAACNGNYYGAGGGAYGNAANSQLYAGAGHQGAVCLRFFNPDKAALPAINDSDLIPYVSLITRLERLEQKLNESLVYNTEEVLTQSGDYTVPVTGWYEVTAIMGGDGGSVSSNPNSAWSGQSGVYKTKLLRLTKGEVINCAIGAAGMGQALSSGLSFSAVGAGGATSFGDYLVAERDFRTLQKLQDGGGAYFPQASKTNSTSGGNNYALSGGGLGGGISTWNADADVVATHENGHWYGAGGAASAVVNGQHSAGNGYQGCIRLRYYDPDKTLNS